MTLTKALPTLACAAALSILSATANPGNATAAPLPLDGYTPYWITLSTSQTSWVAQNSIGSFLSTLPAIPRLLYTQELGLSLQEAATRVAPSGGCLEIGLYTASNGAAAINFLGELPATQCVL